MTGTPQPTIICLASFFKGNEFIREAKRQGLCVVLLTREKLLQADWARDSLDELLAIPGRVSTRSYLEAAIHVAHRWSVEHVVALEEYDIVTAAHIREHFCIPGMGTTTARCFQDKLAMRVKAANLGLPQPDFISLNNYENAANFISNTPGPWMLKPRVGASTMGIKKLTTPDAVWKTISDLEARDDLDETAAFHLLEQYIPAEVYHVDSLVEKGEIRFANVGHYCAAPFQISQFGGVNLAHTVLHNSKVEKLLLDLNKRLLRGFSFESGVTHAEFLRHVDDLNTTDTTNCSKSNLPKVSADQFYFLEVAARVGGAYTAETIEGTTGINLWREWARVELAKETPYRTPTVHRDYGGIAVSLAREEYPSTKRFRDPEIFYRVNKPWHLGLIVRSESYERVLQLLAEYDQAFRKEFTAIAPPEEKPGHYV